MDIIQTFIDGLSSQWCWLIAGTLFISLEILLPEVYLLWLGLAALSVASITFFISIDLPQQVIVFTLSSLVLIILSRRLLKREKKSDYKNSDHLNERMQSYIGREVTLTSPIINGKGRIKIDDTLWIVTGPELAAGELCIITEAHDMVFKVTPA